MKKITLLLLAFAVSSISLTAQTYYSTQLNGGTVYNSNLNTDQWTGFGWAGTPNHSFGNATKSMTLVITDYDASNPSVGDPLVVKFGRNGMGSGALQWNFDNDVTIATLTAADFTGGSATVNFDIPTGTIPVDQTTNYVGYDAGPPAVQGYMWLLQIAGANPPGDPTFINYTINIENEILNVSELSNGKLNASYISSIDAVVINDNNLDGRAYKVFNMLGQNVLEGDVSREINVSALKSGLFILATEEGSFKFLK